MLLSINHVGKNDGWCRIHLFSLSSTYYAFSRPIACNPERGRHAHATRTTASCRNENPSNVCHPRRCRVLLVYFLSYRKSYTPDQHTRYYTRDEGKFLQRIVHSFPMPQRSLLLIIIMLKGAEGQFQLPTTHHAPPREHDELSAQPNRYLTLVFWANETTSCHERGNFHAVKKKNTGKGPRLPPQMNT